MTTPLKEGILLVFDGPDGCGKQTQAKLMQDMLRKLGHETETIAFPRYGEASAKNVEDYLSGKFGQASEVDGKRVSRYFADDRKAAAPIIRKWLSAGKVVIADRYPTANMGHQGAKLPTASERAEFFEWVDQLEYEENKLPRPDATIIVVAPAKVCLANIEARGEEKDVEENIEHLTAAVSTYYEIAALFPERIQLIECAEDDAMRSRESIHEEIYREVVSPLLEDMKTTTS